MDKTFLKTNSYLHYHQVLLDLEADQKLLHLCAAHWNADTLIGQALMQQNVVEKTKANNFAHAASNSQPLGPLASLVPSVLSVAKQVLDWSPGPKSPTTSQASKHSKESAVSRKQASSYLGPSNCEYSKLNSFKPVDKLHTAKQRPMACKIVPTFLSSTVETHAKPAHPKILPLYVEPSVVPPLSYNHHSFDVDFEANNLIGESHLPALTLPLTASS